MRFPKLTPTIGCMDTDNFSWQSEVRDYECDMQGIVNNAVYQNYLEHARHLFLKNIGIDFAEVTLRGIYFIVTRIEIDYKYPLRAGNRFSVTAEIERVSRVRFAFLQEITCLDNDKLCIKARVMAAAMNREGRPIYPRELEELFPGMH